MATWREEEFNESRPDWQDEVQEIIRLNLSADLHDYLVENGEAWEM